MIGLLAQSHVRVTAPKPKHTPSIKTQTEQPTTQGTLTFSQAITTCGSTLKAPNSMSGWHIFYRSALVRSGDHQHCHCSQPSETICPWTPNRMPSVASAVCSFPGSTLPCFAGVSSDDRLICGATSVPFLGARPWGSAFATMMCCATHTNKWEIDNCATPRLCGQGHTERPVFAVMHTT